MPVIVGVDGCPGGWIAVCGEEGSSPAAAVFPTFAALLDAFPSAAVIAVDMPIGLPECTRRGGRGPEALVRRLIGQRRSSVFSIPSRAAVYAEAGPFISADEWYAAHRRASAVARRTSDPPRGVSIQAFAIFPKIREIDLLLRTQPELRSRVFESHPEVAFAQLNGGPPMLAPKKVRNLVSRDGLVERKALLARCGYAAEFFERRPPAGANSDDLLDAACMMLVARRISRGEAISYPDPPDQDAFGIPIAIRA